MSKNLLFLGVIALSLYGCNSKNNEEPTPQKSDKHRLLTSVVVDVGNGTQKVSYEYDSHNRMIAQHSSVTGEASGDVADHVYVYDNQGNVIKSTITRRDQLAIFDYTYKNGVPTFIQYSQPGNPSQGHTLEIASSNDQVTGHLIKTPSGESSFNTFTYSNQNKTGELHKAFNSNNIQDFTFTSDDVYGSKNGPYLYSGSKWLLPDLPYSNKNELLKETSNNNGAISIDIYQYTYDAQNYPIKALRQRTYGTKSESATIIYTYVDAK